MRVKDIKAAILKKGWAGRTLSRKETIERLNPLIQRHMALNRAYDHAIRTCPDAAPTLDVHQKKARVDVGKLIETVFSCGGLAYNGVGMAPEAYASSEAEQLLTLKERETALQETLLEECDLEHQMRTEAVLRRCIKNSEDRLNFVRQCAPKRRILRRDPEE